MVYFWIFGAFIQLTCTRAPDCENTYKPLLHACLHVPQYNRLLIDNQAECCGRGVNE